MDSQVDKQLNKAIEIVTKAHKGQVDKDKSLFNKDM